MIQDDKYWMLKAINLARKGIGFTRPNPPVGAVVVKNGLLCGSGYHSRAGEPHAEIIAIKKAGTDTRGATLYVTLEPCCTWGKTPPCTDAIISAGIKRVVVAVEDPNPKHKGKGITLLRQAGIDVTTGVCQTESEKLIAPFKKWITTGTPYLTLKLAITLDGRIADHTGHSKWISCDESRDKVQLIRNQVDAIMVGAQTIRTDNPSLLPPPEHDSCVYRVIVSTDGNLPSNARVLNDDFSSRTIIATTSLCKPARMELLKKKAGYVFFLPLCHGGVSLKSLMRKLGSMGLLHVLCEGGGKLSASLIQANLVDEYLFFIAPKILGACAIPAVGRLNVSIKTARKLIFDEYRKIGNDIFVRALPIKQG
jgi:diaminohydroxyphosphoribosylaminopyrimidine deaminase/5-amino-6-(5-phosphoribosylamino)uracil reductase